MCQNFARDPDLDVDGHAFFHGVLAAGDPLDGLCQVLALAFGQEPHMAEIDAQQRDVEFPHQLGGPQDGAVPAEHHNQFDVREPDVVVEDLDGLVEPPEKADHVTEFGFLHHRNDAGGVELRARFPGRREGFLAPCVGKDEDTPAHQVPPSSASSALARLFRVTPPRLRHAPRS